MEQTSNNLFPKEDPVDILFHFTRVFQEVINIVIECVDSHKTQTDFTHAGHELMNVTTIFEDQSHSEVGVDCQFLTLESEFHARLPIFEEPKFDS